MPPCASGANSLFPLPPSLRRFFASSLSSLPFVASWLVPSLLLLPACSTNQQADVDTYRAISDPPSAAHSTHAPDELPLVEALRQTALVNEQLASRGEQYIQALAARQRASAALKPTVDLFANLTLRENTGARTGSGSVAQSDLGASGQYRLLTGMSDLRNVEASESTVRSRFWLILDLRESLLLQTAQAYYDALRADRLVDVLLSSERVQQERLEDARARNTVGFARPLDVAQIQAQVSRTRTQLIDARRQAAQARATLELLTRAPVTDRTALDASTAAQPRPPASAPLTLTDGFTVPERDFTASEALAVALAHRQDVLAARNDADAARLLVDAAIGQYAPSITLNLDYFLLRSPDAGLPMVTSLIQARVPVFSAGRIEADVRESWSVFRERILDYQLRVREVRRDVDTALIQLHASRTRLAELQTQVEAARQSLELAEASYSAGLGTNLERVTAQDELLSAQLQSASEEFTLKTTYLALQRACGLLSSELLSTDFPELLGAERTPPPDSPFLDRPPPPPSPDPDPGSARTTP